MSRLLRVNQPCRTLVGRPLVALLLLFGITLALVSVSAEEEEAQQCSFRKPPSSSNTLYSYFHLVVLVHGYMGSDKEQAYLGDALIRKSKLLLCNTGANNTCSSSDDPHHQFLVLSSKANVNDTTDGVAKGGQRLAAEVMEWIREYSALIHQQGQEQQQENESTTTVMTLSFVGNSLGGLYSRYAVAELQDTLYSNSVLPLVFCTTSSPHLGVSQETFVLLPRWAEKIFAMTMQQTGADLFGVHLPNLICGDMCFNDHFLRPLRQFQKRIAVANAYNTDFLVSVSSAAFLSAHSDSLHCLVNNSSSSNRLMVSENVALQVTTTAIAEDDDTGKIKNCADSLDRLGWTKVFMDTRDYLPVWSRLSTPELPEEKWNYTSKELRQHFARFGTLIPVAHPLNMANSKTDWYSQLTKKGRPIMDALAEMLVLDMMELSTRSMMEERMTRSDEDRGGSAMTES